MIADEIVYQRYLSGEDSAANILVERYGDTITLYVNGYLRDIHESEDLMIEAFSRVFARERPIRGDGAFKAYLYKTARNLALRHLHKHRFLQLRLEDVDFDLPDDVLTDTGLILDERRRYLYAALEKLKAEYREALYLVYFEEMHYREAAAVMGKSEQQITKLVYRGKQRLRTLLEKEGFVYEDV